MFCVQNSVYELYYLFSFKKLDNKYRIKYFPILNPLCSLLVRLLWQWRTRTLSWHLSGHAGLLTFVVACTIALYECLLKCWKPAPIHFRFPFAVHQSYCWQHLSSAVQKHPTHFSVTHSKWSHCWPYWGMTWWYAGCCPGSIQDARLSIECVLHIPIPLET